MATIKTFYYTELSGRANQLLSWLDLGSKEAARDYFANNKVKPAEIYNIGKKTLAEIREWLDLPDNQVSIAISLLESKGYIVTKGD